MKSLWVTISIIALIIIVVLLLIGRGGERQYPKPSNPAILGISLVVLGTVSGDASLIG